MLIVQLPAFFFLGALVLAYPETAGVLFCLWLVLIVWRSL